MNRALFLTYPPEDTDDAIIGELRDEILRLRDAKPTPLPTVKDYEREVKRHARNRKARERRRQEKAAEVAVVEWVRETFTTTEPESIWYTARPRGWWAVPVVAVMRVAVSLRDDWRRMERGWRLVYCLLAAAVMMGLVV